jgi:hypothetical protein
MNPAAAQQALRRLVPERLPVLLTGAPGVGKTASVQAVARHLGCELVVSHPVTADPTDFRGLPWMVDGRAAFLPVGDLERLASIGDRPAIWLIDDLGQAPAAVQAAVMQLVHKDGRALNGFALPERVSVVACTNRAQDRAGVGCFLAPLLSRFACVLEIVPEPVSFVHWAIREGGFNPLVASFLRWKPDYLLDEQPPAHSLQPRCSPRTWESASRILDAGPPPEILDDLLKGALTPAIAIEFLAYLQVFHALPNADLVRASPDTAPVPSAPDAAYATVVHLALAATPGDFPPFCRYVERLAPEYRFLFMLTATARKPELTQTAAYIAWATHPDNVALLN